jgi:hypothetical protein
MATLLFVTELCQLVLRALPQRSRTFGVEPISKLHIHIHQADPEAQGFSSISWTSPLSIALHSEVASEVCTTIIFGKYCCEFPLQRRQTAAGSIDGDEHPIFSRLYFCGVFVSAANLSLPIVCL